MHSLRVLKNYRQWSILLTGTQFNLILLTRLFKNDIGSVLLIIFIVIY